MSATAQLSPARDRPGSRSPIDLAALTVVVPLVASVLGYESLRASKASKIGQYGLIQALHPAYYVVVGVVIASFLVSLHSRWHRSLILSLHIAALIYLLHGPPAIIESEPRFPTAYLHAGFTNYVAHSGKLLPGLDARFSWPSFFTGSAMLTRAAGIHTAVHLIRWWPVAMNLLYTPLMWLIARHMLGNRDMAWIAAGLFPVANWVGQDYYSPQSVGFLLYLAFIFVLVGPLGGEGPPIWRWWSARRRGRSMPVPDRTTEWGPIWLWAAASVLLMLAMATGHQVTPIMACGSAALIAASGRTRARALVGAYCFITLGWICYGAVAFWSGHLGQLFGQVGSVGGNVSSSVLRRLNGTHAHQFVVDDRIVMSIAVWVLAALGALLWKGSPAGRRAAFVTMAWPILLLAAQSYGGEAVLRIYLFSLPGALCCLAALVGRLRWRPVLVVAEMVVFAMLVPMFLFARWGNELFEETRPTEVAGVNALYRIAPHGSSLVSISPQIPWSFDNVTTYQYEPQNLDEFALRSLPAVENLFTSAPAVVRHKLKHPRRGYVIITTGQVDYGWQEYGLPRNWGQQVIALLSSSPKFRLVYQNPATVIFEYQGPVT